MSAADTFDRVMGEFDTPMVLVTCRPPGEPAAGCLVGFATHCSVDPPRFLACLSHVNHTYGAAGRSAFLAVHLVPGTATRLAELFGGETEEEVDKFTRCAWRPGAYEAPILDECPNWFVGRVLDRRDLGDHTGFLLEPVAAAHREGHVGLGQRRARRIEPGRPA
ncbi:MAG: flavin reductase family protein [Solirubrobacteraceae bacterium]